VNTSLVAPKVQEQSNLNSPAPMLAAALAWARLGVPVFPCRPRGKKPLHDGSFKGATTDPEKIQAWWADHPEANIAAPTGEASGFDVVDLDTKKGANGDANWTALARAYGGEGAPLVQRTASGGYHLFYSHTEGLRGSVGRVGRTQTGKSAGIDVRANGGYVLLAPSRVVYTAEERAEYPELPDCGSYAWEDEALGTAKLSPMPAELAEICRRRVVPPAHACGS
jgi:hypothetical protein